MGYINNYYEVLELKETASQEEIKNAYIYLAKEYHPDRIPGHLFKMKQEAEEKFKQINEAYGVLSNPEKRREYDILLNRLRKIAKESNKPDFYNDSTSTISPSSNYSYNTYTKAARKNTLLNVGGWIILVIIGLMSWLLIKNLSNDKIQKRETEIPETLTTDNKIEGSNKAMEKKTTEKSRHRKELKKTEIKDTKKTDNKIEGSNKAIAEKTTEKLRHRKKQKQKNKKPTFGVQRITGEAYSYPKERWAGINSPFKRYGSNGYFPKVDLVFWTGLIIESAVIRWDGEYKLASNEICLTIKNLKIDGTPHILEDFYTDIGIGFNVLLRDAVFGDYTMARTIMLFRTFSGDNPPPKISKSFEIIPIIYTEIKPFLLEGVWEGTYYTIPENENIDHINFMARFEQKGNKFNGVIIDYNLSSDNNDSSLKKRARVRGWIIDDNITFVKTYKKDINGFSYVATYKEDDLQIEGNWYHLLTQGKWKMKHKGDFNGSVEDILTLDVKNPPEKKH